MYSGLSKSKLNQYRLFPKQLNIYLKLLNIFDTKNVMYQIIPFFINSYSNINYHSSLIQIIEVYNQIEPHSIGI